MKKGRHFQNIIKKKKLKSFSQWLESQGYDPQTLDLESLLEAGAWEKAKKWGKGAALAGALGAATLGIMPQGDSDAPSKQPQSQSQSQEQQAQDGVSVDGDTITVRFSSKNPKYSQAKAYDMLAKHLNTNRIPPGSESSTRRGDDGLWHTTVKLSKSGQAHAEKAAAGMGSGSIIQRYDRGEVAPLPSGQISPDADL